MLKKCQAIEYLGTIESFNEIKEKCLNSEEHKVYFINEKGHETNQFHEKFIVYPMGILYKKGDYLFYEVD